MKMKFGLVRFDFRLVDDFAQGSINRTQFHGLYDRYQRQLSSLMQITASPSDLSQGKRERKASDAASGDQHVFAFVRRSHGFFASHDGWRPSIGAFAGPSGISA